MMTERFVWHYNQVSCTLFFFYFLCLFGYFRVDCSSSFHYSSPKTTHFCPPEEGLALLQFRNKTFFSSGSYSYCNGQIFYPKTNSWTEGTDCCSWDGVTCDNVTGNVIGLDSSCSRLEGSIDDNSSLFHLSHLQSLNLAFNDFGGSQISPVIGRLKELTYLNLSSSYFGGLVPYEISHLSKLTHLELSENDLTIEEKTFDLLVSNLTKLSLLKLEATNLSLIKPFSLINLSSTMTDLDLNRASIQGNFPDEIFRLPNLQALDLHGNNQLTGHLPNSNWSSPLRKLHLSSTNFAGRVPSWLFTLPSLMSINLAWNKLNGPIDPFQSPNSLQEVRLQKNEIHGAIPYSIFQLSNLTHLDLSSNNLSGTVKFDMFSKLQSLQYLYLSNNSLLSFTSSSNMDIKYSLPSLQELNLSNCNINQFPSFLRNSEKLTSLDLSNGRIRGRISKHDSKGWKSLIDLDLSNNFLTHIALHPWKNIKTLDLRNNKIQGSILVPPPSTQVFLVSNNKLSGAIPPSICSLSSLQYLSLSHNNLSGTIPSCLGNFSTQLIFLDLKNNSLEGHIHDNFANASYLRSLDLNSNKLEGPLPRSLANCRILEVVNVGKNMISDTFPCWLGSLPELKILVLRSNRFYGPLCKSNSTFPFQALRIIDLSHNEFTGSLPRTIFVSMEAMKIVDEMKFGLQYIGGFYYLDSVTVAMKGQDVLLYKILIIFRASDFSSNRFHGEVPEVLGNFKSLKVLNLSHNSLTGNIPASLGNITALESLDLSFNKLHGIIPEQLLAVTALASLNLSYNQLWGRIPRGNQFNTFDNNSYIGNIHLCGEPLTVTCSNDGLPKAPPSASTDHEEDETASWFDWKMAKLGYASGLVIGLSIGYMVLSIGRPRWLVKMVERDQQNKVRRRRPRHRM
ncbi:Receptor-like protein 33 [Citrus sinensis]|uniref:Receptor-like protein 33 n=1 Tax=Citrus sinensis TaxID=2711 RepID=A0ACB8M2Z9_CITSI|nr:Receptor-like protein 33 [Citrus sinensis]